MKLYITFSGCALFCLSTLATARDPSWYPEKIAEIQGVASLPPSEQIEKLGALVRIGSQRFQGHLHLDEEESEVLAAAQNAIIAIPGHAEYYRDKINQGWDAYEKALVNSPEDASALARKNDIAVKLRNDMMYGTASLGQMPSPETVRVLGEMLMDDRIYPKDDLLAWREALEKNGVTPPSVCGLNGLQQLPLTSRPTQRKGGWAVYEEDIDAWRLWYGQVKAGTRTFRFEGDSQEYSLKGPVATPATPKQRPVKDLATGVPDALPSPSSRWPLIAILAALVACGAAGWRVWRQKAAQPSSP